MLFNNSLFVFLFLPISLLGFYVLGRLNPTWAKLWLTGASAYFYAVWRPKCLLILLGSVLINYWIGEAIHRTPQPRRKKLYLVLGIVANLGLLGFFKYTGFLLETVDALSGLQLSVQTVLLPLAISFFTFTQIAYLVDIYSSKARRYGLLDYGLFVTFFPHLLAGPIVHHWEVLPQFDKSSYRPKGEDFTVGLTIFLIGLFKKLLADSIAPFATVVFGVARVGGEIGFFDAWGGALAYALQIYFDFSGYSDMAIGLARLFGVKFPLNFNSPYKSVSIVDFWRRWHITLSHFLRDYLYIPLGGNRKGPGRRYLNLFVTMLIGGLWHGASWTFVAWGGLHGLYLTVNHLWSAGTKNWRLPVHPVVLTVLGQSLTFFCITIAWVLFRADNWTAVGAMFRGMAGFSGAMLPTVFRDYFHLFWPVFRRLGVTYSASALLDGASYALILSLLAIAWFTPNTQQWLANAKPALEPVENAARYQWQPYLTLGMALGFLLFFVFKTDLDAVSSSFLYFKF